MVNRYNSCSIVVPYAEHDVAYFWRVRPPLDVGM